MVRHPCLVRLLPLGLTSSWLGNWRVPSIQFILRFHFFRQVSPTTKGHSITSITMKVMVSEWLAIVSSSSSVAHLTGVPPVMDPSSCQKEIGVFNGLCWIPSLPTKVGLIRFLMHPKSNNALKLTFLHVYGIDSSMGIRGSTVSFINRSS